MTYDCFCTIMKKKSNCERENFWPAKQKIFTIWSFKENLLTTAIETYTDNAIANNVKLSQFFQYSFLICISLIIDV